MVSEGLWIAIAVIAVLLVAALVVGLLRYRKRRISLARPDTATPVDRSGGYTASSGITFSQATPTVTPPEVKPPSRPEPAPPSRPDTAPPQPERIDTTGLPAVGDDATIPRDAPKRPIADVTLPEPTAPPVERPAPPAETPPPVAPAEAAAPEAPAPEEIPTGAEAPDIEAIAPPEGRLDRLRGRLAKSQNTLGRSMLGLLGGGDLDEESWEEIEDTLLIADLGPVVTQSVIAALRAKMASA